MGKWFPTGAHKVGATFACLVPRLVTGQFDPTSQKAVWPSTGNFCRGGAYNAALLGCESIAILPEEMSRERFEWLRKLAGEVIATPGSESNVKEIFDKCHELRATRDNIVIFNQFEEYGNHLWHYDVTGGAIEEVLPEIAGPGDRLSGFVSETGSAGTIGAGDRLKEMFPGVKVAAGEALQCPTLLENGYGSSPDRGYRRQAHPLDSQHAQHGRGDRRGRRELHEPDPAVQRASRPGIPEEAERAGRVSEVACLSSESPASGTCSLRIKLAKYFELTERDFVFTIMTDSMDLYQTRVEELRQELAGPTPRPMRPGITTVTSWGSSRTTCWSCATPIASASTT